MQFSQQSGICNLPDKLDLRTFGTLCSKVREACQRRNELQNIQKLAGCIPPKVLAEVKRLCDKSGGITYDTAAFTFSTQDILKIRSRSRLEPGSDYRYLMRITGLEPANICPIISVNIEVY